MQEYMISVVDASTTISKTNNLSTPMGEMATIVSSRSLNNITAAQNRDAPQRRPSDGDLDIAHGLLIGPRIPTRKYSVSQLVVRHSARSSMCDDTNDKIKNPESTEELPHQNIIHISNAWTSSSGDASSDCDDNARRRGFLDEYNRLANKHGVRIFGPEDDEADSALTIEKPSWFKRNILRRVSSVQSMKADVQLKHRRSISDLTGRLKSRKYNLKDRSLQELVRLCGLSSLYLPTEYASHSLSLPTCFRATAQYLVQYGVNSRGIFRIPGSHSIVTALYNHYGNLDGDGDVIANTVHCPTLPLHIKCDVHDVASAFKKFLAGLPSGILGSLPLFYSLVSIHNQLLGDPEITKTKHTKVRARLIALTMLSLKSQHRRNLICAVFGLLSMIGRAAETAPREDDRGRPLPTSDLMGYAPLGIVFGPLLLGELLDHYTIRVANPHGPLVLLPVSPQQGRKEKHSRPQKDYPNIHSHKRSKSSLADERVLFSTQVEKVKVANDVTEMLITHWRDVVRHLKALQPSRSVMGTKDIISPLNQSTLRPSVSDSFTLRKPPDWGGREVDEAPITPTRGCMVSQAKKAKSRTSVPGEDKLIVRKQRNGPRHMASQNIKTSKSMIVLSPTKEEFSDQTYNEMPSSSKQTHEASKSRSPRSPNQKENQEFKETSMIDLSVQFTADNKGVLEARSEKPMHLKKAEQIVVTKPVEILEHFKRRPAKNSSSKATTTRSTGIQTMSKVVESRRRRTAATDPGNWPLKPARLYEVFQTRAAESTRHAKRLESGDGAGRDPLENVSHDDDLESLSALGKALTSSESVMDVLESRHLDKQELDCQNSMKSLRRRFKSGNADDLHQSKGFNPQNPVKNSPSSPMRLLKKLGSQRNRYSNKASSTLNTFSDCSLKSQTGLVSSCNSITISKLPPRTPSPDKLAKVQLPIHRLGSNPHGTVRALAAKFDTVDQSSIQPVSPAKSSKKDAFIPSDSPKKVVVATYTINEESPTRLHKSDTRILPGQSLGRSRSVEAGILMERNEQFTWKTPSSPCHPLHDRPRYQSKVPTVIPSGTTPIRATRHNPGIAQRIYDQKACIKGSPVSTTNHTTQDLDQLIPLPLKITPSSGSQYSSHIQASPYSTTNIQCTRDIRAPRSPHSPLDTMHFRSRPVSLPSPSILPRALSTGRGLVKYDLQVSRAFNGIPRSLPELPTGSDTLKETQMISSTLSGNTIPVETKAPIVVTTPENTRTDYQLIDGLCDSPDPTKLPEFAIKAPRSAIVFSPSHNILEEQVPHGSLYPALNRSSSVLSAQVHALKKDLKLKSDEIHCLKQSLNSQISNAEVEVLRQQLMSAKDEICVWQSKFQIAEKKIELLIRDAASICAGFHPHMFTTASLKTQQNSPWMKDCYEEYEDKISEQLLKDCSIRLDGASSAQRNISGGSSATIIQVSEMEAHI